jgi:hypothetical protein
MLEFALTLILAFYLNRWIRKKPAPERIENESGEHNSVGERVVDLDRHWSLQAPATESPRRSEGSKFR